MKHYVLISETGEVVAQGETQEHGDDMLGMVDGKRKLFTGKALSPDGNTAVFFQLVTKETK